jgi:hypothetical protein
MGFKEALGSQHPLTVACERDYRLILERRDRNRVQATKIQLICSRGADPNPLIVCTRSPVTGIIPLRGRRSGIGSRTRRGKPCGTSMTGGWENECECDELGDFA